MSIAATSPKTPPCSMARKSSRALASRALAHRGALGAALLALTGALAAVLAAAVVGAAPASAQTTGDTAYTMDVMAEGLKAPWAIAPLPDGDYVLTERDGDLLRLSASGETTKIEGMPEAFVAGQGGLQDVALHPQFARNGLVYVSFAEGTPEANGTAIVRGRLTGNTLEDAEVIFRAAPPKDTPVHYGARMAFLPDTTLLLTIGDGFDYREDAQRLESHLGSIVRLTDDGSVPADNPFAGKDGTLPELWSIGHRNAQGIVVDPRDGRVYAHEHGPRGGDELNLILPGRNYGWPVITYGVDYSGALISPFTEREGLEQPLKYWVPSIAPSGMMFYRGAAFPEWQDSLFIAALVPGDVRRIPLTFRSGEPVLGEEDVLFSELGKRIRDIREDRDGALLILTDGSDGQVLRVTPNRSSL